MHGFDRFSAIVLGYGFQRSISNHYVFVRYSSTGTIILIVYVDDIIISRIESVGIVDLKMLVDTAASLGSYHTMNRPSITFIFVVGTVSQFMHAACHPHFSYLVLSEGGSWTRTFVQVVPLYVAGFSDADWVGSLSNRQSTSGYCTFVTGNLVTWCNKTQNVVARSSVEAEY